MRIKLDILEILILFQAGYLEGIEAGKQQGLEEGFHQGFVRGIQCTIHWAVLRGKIRLDHQQCYVLSIIAVIIIIILTIFMYSALHAHCSKFAKEEDPYYSQVSIQLSELLEVVREREKRWTEVMLAEETQSFQMKCSQLVDQAKSQEAKETAASSDSSITLKELISLETLLPHCQDELQELYTRLEQLQSQLRLAK